METDTNKNEDKKELLFDVPEQEAPDEIEFTKALDKLSKTDRHIFEDTGVIHIDRNMPAETQTLHVVELQKKHAEKRNKVFQLITVLLVVGVVISAIGICLNRYLAKKQNVVKEEAAVVGTTDPNNIVIDESSFPDALFRNYISEQTDTNADGQLSADERNAVILLIAPEDSALTSVKGVELFPLLKSVTVANTGITDLDVLQNKELSYIDISNTPLTELNLTGLEKLTDIRAENTSLTTVYFPADSQITSFDFAGSTFECSTNSSGFYSGCKVK